MTTGPQRRRRAGDGGGGPVTEEPGSAVRTPDSLLRGPVSTALTLASLPSKHPVGIVGILRVLSGVPRRYAFNVSTMDTSDLPGPARPLPFGASSPTGQSTCPGAQLSSLRVRPRRRHGAQRPSRRRRPGCRRVCATAPKRHRLFRRRSRAVPSRSTRAPQGPSARNVARTAFFRPLRDHDKGRSWRGGARHQRTR